jgi:nicotinate phosphoribosyltransferase
MMIKSILDTDLYKLTMQQLALELFPDSITEYRFTNRGKHGFTPEFVDNLRKIIDKEFPKLTLTQEEYDWLRKKCPYFKVNYLEYLRNYRFNPNEVAINVDVEGKLDITIKGPWHSTILWEVPLMATISELYFQTIDTDWNTDGQLEKMESKASVFNAYGPKFNLKTMMKLADFGTRRRRSFEVQDLLIKTWKDQPFFVGTSNVHLAMKHDITPIGTMAHELCQAMAALESMNHPNYHMLQNWVKIYNADLGIALTDTYGTDSFLENFNLRFAKLYDGVRHDSGCPYEFADKIINHYKSLNIDPMSKVIVFSDGLDAETAYKIAEYCDRKIKCAFGIGTNLTNDFDSSKALNMVIKLWYVNEIPVVKLSDTPGKESGDPKMVKVMKYIHRKEFLADKTMPLK